MVDPSKHCLSDDFSMMIFTRNKLSLQMWVGPLMRPTSLRVIFIKVNKRRNSELRGHPQVSLRKAPNE